MTKAPNLDAMAAWAADEMCKAIDGKKVSPEEADTAFTKALAMVQESGIYAATIYLQYRSGEKRKLDELKAEEQLACHALSALVRLLGRKELGGLGLAFGGPAEPGDVNGQKAEMRKHMAGATDSGLEQVLLVKQLWEQALTYARYIARGQKKGKATGGGA